MTRFVLVWMFFPLVLGIPAMVIGGVLGCRMDAEGPHPCQIFGIGDIGQILAFGTGMLSIAPLTIITGILLAIPLAFAKGVSSSLGKKSKR